MTAGKQPTADCPRCGRALPKAVAFTVGGRTYPITMWHTVEGDVCPGVSPECRETQR